ncbi:RPTN protein, partial [Glaucidium brasilianum]|nr:RPTN protein [Glaucidium brasilianum]
MSRFLDSICTIISTFHKHAKEDGDYSRLSRQKMKQFIEREFADAMAKPRDPQTIDKILQFLEWDGDGEIDFNEFLIVVFRVAKSCYWYLPKGPCLLQRTELKTKQLADVRSRSQTCEPQPLPNRWSSRQPQEAALQANDQKNQRPQEADKGSHKERRKHELLGEVKNRYHVRELEQKELEHRSHQPHEPESLDSTRPHQSYIEEPLELDLRNNDTCEAERETCDQVKKEDQKITSQESEKDIHQDEKQEEQQLSVRERRTDRQRDLEVEVYERRSQQTREREEQGATRDPRENSERRECQRRDPDKDGRRQRETVRYERTREAAVAAAEADVRIRRVTREREPREKVERRECARDSAEQEGERRVCREGEREEPLRERRTDRQWDLDVGVYERRSRQTREREERGATRDPRETCERRECQRRDPEDDGRRQRETVRYERTRETAVAAAEADVRIRRVTREREPRDDVARRECARDCAEPEEERRVCREGEREEPLRERRFNHQRELDVEVYEHRSRQTREREERGATSDQRETCERRE